jgi:hypothetical protein
MPIALSDGQSITGLAISLDARRCHQWRRARILGMPLAGAQVQVQLATIVNGERRLVSPQAGMTLAITNDLGEYRAWGLPPGEYIVRALGGGAQGSGSARPATEEEFAAALREASSAPATQQRAANASPAPQLARLPSYFPGGVDPAQARGIVLAAGDDRVNVDIVSQVGRVARASGAAVGPEGPVTNMLVGLANVSAGSLNSSPGFVRPDSKGEFTIPVALTPGRWLLFGRGAPVGVPSDKPFPWWAETEFVVGDQDLTGLVLSFAPGAPVTGKLVFDGTAAAPDLSRLRVSLTYIPPINGMSALIQPVTPQADGTFRFDAVPPGRYRVSVSAAGAWSLHSATAGSRDVLDTPLEIAGGDAQVLALTMTDRATEIAGLVLDQLGRPAPEYSVVIISADRAMWTVSPRRSSGLVKLASDGRYRVTGLPAGDYLLCVVTDLDAGQLADIAILEDLSRAGVPVAFSGR